MRYSFVATGLFAAVVVANTGYLKELPDGQPEQPVGYEHASISESTVYSTAEVTITSCDSTVKNCPAHSKTTVPVIVTPSASVSIPVYVSKSTEVASSISSVPVPIVPESSVPVVTVTLPSVPIVPSVSVPVPSVPVSSIPIVPVPSVPASSIRNVPVPSVPTSTFPIGTAPVSSACPVCPLAATVYLTVTASPTGISTPKVPVTVSSGPASVPTEESSVPVPVPTDESTVPVVPVPNPSISVPIIPIPVSPSGAVPGVPAPTGTVPAGTGASTGFITGPKPTGTIVPFIGAANTLSSSLMVTGLAAFAALLLA